MSVLLHLALVAAGSALGGLARYGVGNLVMKSTGLPIHWANVFINITGSFVLGWFLTMMTEVWTSESAPWIRLHKQQIELLIAVGFTGGYTTFSAFEADAYRLIKAGSSWTAIFYVTGSVFLGLVAFRSGMLLATLFSAE